MNLKYVAAAIAMSGVFVLGVAYRPHDNDAPVRRERAPEPALPAAAPAPMPEVPVKMVPTKESTPMPEPAPTTDAPVAGVQPDAAAPAAMTLPEGWQEHVGQGRGVWVNVSEQKYHVIENGAEIWSAPCATAEKGVGAEMHTEKTPSGWHRVAEAFGDGAPVGQVFRSRKPTKERWKPGDNTTEDLVLTRVLWLEGLDPGQNKGLNAAGKNVDSKERCIYIHGTNAEQKIGTPSSHGCIRLTNADVLKAFELTPVGTPVVITE